MIWPIVFDLKSKSNDKNCGPLFVMTVSRALYWENFPPILLHETQVNDRREPGLFKEEFLIMFLIMFLIVMFLIIVSL